MVIYLNIMGVLLVLAGVVIGFISGGMAWFLFYVVLGVMSAVPYFLMSYLLSGLRTIQEEHIARLYEKIHELSNRLTELESSQ